VGGRAGKNLTFSTLLEPDIEPADQFLITRITSLALIDALKLFGIEAMIKWPNDIYAGDKKIAGILIENDILGSRITRSIVGIGLNVNQIQFHPDIPNPTSIALETGRESDIMDLFAVIMERIESRLGESKELLNREYAERLYRLGVKSKFLDQNGKPFEAVIEGVEPSGELLVECENVKKRFLFKEIEYLRL